ncbi:hypothetical protein ACF0H5_004575 [Mactra antiquata]
MPVAKVTMTNDQQERAEYSVETEYVSVETQDKGTMHDLEASQSSHTFWGEKLLNIFADIKDSIGNLCNNLEVHMKTTERNFGQLRDEIHSMKKHMTCINNDTSSHFEEINEETKLVKLRIDQNNDAVVRRLQSVTDAIKQISLRPTNSRKEDRSDTNPGSMAGTSSGFGFKNIGNSHDSQRTNNMTTTVQDRTLLIGDSILNGVQTPGLSEKVDLERSGCAKIEDVREKIEELDIGKYTVAILYIGGNDLNVMGTLQERQCRAHLCTVCPRRDVDIRNFNTDVRQICNDRGANMIDCYNAFIYDDGTPVRHFFASDNLHLSVQGSKTLVTTFNKNMHIIRRPARQQTISQKTSGGKWAQTGSARPSPPLGNG